MIANTPLDPDRAAALDRFIADIEALHAPTTTRDSVAESLACALHEPNADACWRSLYRAVRVLVARTSVQVRSADAYRRLESFLAENADLDTGIALELQSDGVTYEGSVS